MAAVGRGGGGGGGYLVLYASVDDFDGAGGRGRERQGGRRRHQRIKVRPGLARWRLLPLLLLLPPHLREAPHDIGVRNQASILGELSLGRRKVSSDKEGKGRRLRRGKSGFVEFEPAPGAKTNFATCLFLSLPFSLSLCLSVSLLSLWKGRRRPNTGDFSLRAVWGVLTLRLAAGVPSGLNLPRCSSIPRHSPHRCRDTSMELL